jgi:hypothetical protein
VSLLESLIWGREFEKAPHQPSPSSPSSPARAAAEPKLWSPTCSWNDLRDDYDCRANAALQAIREIAAPEGLIVWLGEHDPSLYQKLTRVLPNRLSRAWDAQVPYQDFDALCFELVDTHAFAAERYRTGYEK